MKKRLRTITIAFTVSFLLMAALSFYSMARLDKSIDFSNQVDHTNEVIRTLFRIEGYVKDLDRGERGFMLTYDTTYSKALARNMDSVRALVQTLSELSADNPVQVQNIVLLKSILALRIGEIKQNIAYLNTTHEHNPSQFYFEGRKEMQECTKKLREMHAEENKLFAERQKNEQFYQELTLSGLRTLLTIFFLLTLSLFYLMIRELKKRMSYQDELHAKLLDLKRSHSELEQIAYVASHDLQEPLRKIQVFANRLIWMKKDTLDADTKTTMERINTSASRMQYLIEDLVNLATLIKENSNKEAVDMNRLLKYAMEELSLKITENEAQISSEALPLVKGYGTQIQILFKALLDNSLKFTRENVKPIIQITSAIVSGEELTEINKTLTQKKFNRITIEDNGIGFDNKFSHKMFQIFQRLHNQHSKFDGKGIGLAICQRIMANHEGYIIAYGHTEIGATFKLFFPVEE